MNETILPGTPLNTTLVTADTEYPITLPAGCQHFSFQCRSGAEVRFAFATGKVAASTAPFLTLKAGQTYTSPEKMALASATLYVASSVAGVIVEVLPWVKP